MAHGELIAELQQYDARGRDLQCRENGDGLAIPYRRSAQEMEVERHFAELEARNDQPRGPHEGFPSCRGSADAALRYRERVRSRLDKAAARFQRVGDGHGNVRRLLTEIHPWAARPSSPRRRRTAKR